MRSLILVRHAKSSRDDPSLADHDRPLSERGIVEATRLGQYAAEHLNQVDEVLCSTALRTQDTWQRMACALEKPPPVRYLPDLYLPSRTGLAKALHEARPHSKTVLVVGHNPSLEAFVRSHAKGLSPELRARLSGGLPTAASVTMSFDMVSFGHFSHQRGHVTELVTREDFMPAHRRRSAKPEKGERVKIDQSTTRAQLASLAIQSAWDQIRINVRGAQLGEDSEFLHHLRVGVRKLRVHLGLFRKQIGRERAKALKAELTWLFRLLGVTRELDVLAEATLPALEGKNDARMKAHVNEALELERAKQRKRLRRALHGVRYERIERELVDLTAELAHRERDKAKRAAPWLTRRLTKHRKHVLSMVKNSDFRDPLEVHAMRKQLKKFRYTAELARGAFAGAATKEFLGQLSDLQDVLGAWNDAVVAQAWLEHFAKELSPARRAQVARAFVAPLEGQRAAKQSDLQRTLGGLLDLEPFWQK
jgi:phosphohistidine phosphatase